MVIDPRRSETARAFEHVAINPDSDAWLLLAMLNVIFAERLEDPGAILDLARGEQALREMAADVTPEIAAERTGIPADHIRQLARDLAGAERAAVYGRTGSCLGRNGTLVSFLLDALNVVTGNLDREGGAMFGNPPVDFAKLADMIGAGTYGKVRSRIGNFPDVLKNLPAGVMAKEITTPGKGQIRALLVSAGNPVLSVPNGEELEEAIEHLDLMVSIDFYVNDTSKHADYVLPATTFLEREDFPVPFLGLFTTPFIQMTDAVVEPAGEARQEWEIIDELSKRMGVAPYSALGLRLLGKAGIRLSPQRLFELLLRTGPKGDLFGLRRGGLNIDKLRRNPHGIVLSEHLEAGVLKGQLRHNDKKVRLDPPEIVAEVKRLASANGHDASFPLRLIGMRELRSHNSWMHNVEKLMQGEREHAARIHPEDATEVGIEDGETVRITSPHGSIETRAKLTDEIKRGTIAVPHGWGHTSSGWRIATAAGRSEREQARLDGPRRPRSAGGNVVPERDPGAVGAGGGGEGRTSTRRSSPDRVVRPRGVAERGAPVVPGGASRGPGSSLPRGWAWRRRAISAAAARGWPHAGSRSPRGPAPAARRCPRRRIRRRLWRRPRRRCGRSARSRSTPGPHAGRCGHARSACRPGRRSKALAARSPPAPATPASPASEAARSSAMRAALARGTPGPESPCRRGRVEALRPGPTAIARCRRTGTGSDGGMG